MLMMMRKKQPQNSGITRAYIYRKKETQSQAAAFLFEASLRPFPEWPSRLGGTLGVTGPPSAAAVRGLAHDIRKRRSEARQHRARLSPVWVWGFD